MDLGWFNVVTEVIIRTGRRALAPISQKVVSNQLWHLKLSLDNVTIFQNENPEIDSMGRLTIFCKNEADISFEIEGIAVEVDVKSEGIPTRGGLNYYPVARFEESSYVMREKDVGHSYTHSTKIKNFRSEENYANIQVEFVLPSWLGKIKEIYVYGFLKVQKDLLKKFVDLKAFEDEISIK
ncbi:hypothetical protein AKJ62_02785 [candidate division MSBL1 archaeon SCGC-AAA259D14]|uniref:Uncharacterized protein n=1 Tax=candidate division MSBL1 archaeon SCGC-AAA259D14 TaxID=1698261 RepID=A0A133U5X0_9EURY|nr:hypothetical protein AKJ62_02785 [candidate division MSBL1 archaeon SCGC-AAA259D14]